MPMAVMRATTSAEPPGAKGTIMRTGRLGKAVWGRGLATAAVKTLVGYGLREFGLTRIFARVFAEHGASIRVLEKAGFSREGVMRRAAIKAGIVRDQVLYAITDQE